MSYDIASNIKSKSGYSAAQIEAAIKAIRPDNGFQGAQQFVDVENKYGINALFVAAHAAIESAWGTSYYAKTRNNLFGFNAYDSNPDQASSYPSQAGSTDFYGDFLNKYYLTPGAIYFNGTTPHGVFVKYSSSHDSEANSVVGIMNWLESKISGQPVAPVNDAPAPATSPPSGGQTYHVASGDNLWTLAHKWGTSVDAIIAANRAKYPNIGLGPNAFLAAGWDIYVPGAGPSPTPVSQSVNLTVPSGREGYLSVIAENYGTSVQQLIDWNRGKYPNIGTGADAHIEAGWNIRVR
jgi:LysM repeat protein